MTQCNCIADIDSKLEKHTLDTAICFSGNALVARTYSGLRRRDNNRSETRSREPRLFAHTFCPFCGERYVAKPIKSAVAATDNEKGGGHSV